MRGGFWRSGDLDLQSKITLVLLAVLVPAFLIVAVAGNALIRPWLENEVRQIATSVGRSFAAEIRASGWIVQDPPSHRLERRIQELVYQQPSIVRMDVVLAADPSRGPWAPVRVVGSNVESEPDALPPVDRIRDRPEAVILSNAEGERFWRIILPLSESRNQGNIHILGSLALAERLHALLWRSTGITALFALLALFFALRFSLRRTIENERRLVMAESRNVQLTEKLHETERELMNTEKLAVMGQLTASFAHEIGTPLNAMGGHLQLLELEVAEARSRERIQVIRSQLEKIESIVKGFLQSTAQPVSQRQLVDLNHLIDKTLSIVAPRAQALGVVLQSDLDRTLGPVRVVPLEFEQILLNLVNNSLDALQSKRERSARSSLLLRICTAKSGMELDSRVELEVYDTGEGISKSDLRNVFKPFFTTKPQGRGTGLGLTISQQLATKNGANLNMSSRRGAWTRVTLGVPYA